MKKKTMNLSLGILIFLMHCNGFAQDMALAKLKEELRLSQDDLDARGRNEIKGFVDSKVWQGGYYEGDPLNPHGDSSYHITMNYKGNQVNPLFICYSECIKPFINPTTNVLEIGPGRGTWSRSILTLNPKHLTCVDALPAEHNQFWSHIGMYDNVKYFQVKDFTLNEIEDDSIDVVFSFGTFCHISSLMCYEYFKNLFQKLRKGGQGFIMFADFDKKKQFAAKHNVLNPILRETDELSFFQYQIDSHNFTPTWYHLGRERAYEILKELGYQVLNIDMEVNERDPVVHFQKPI